MKLVDDWKQSYKHYSQQAKALAVSITAGYLALPEKMQDAINVKYVMWIAIGVLVLGAFGHLVDQSQGDKQ